MGFFFCRGDVLGVVIGVLLLPWGCVGGSYWGSSSAVGMYWGSYWGSSSAVGDVLGVVMWGFFFFCRGDVLGVVIGVLLLPWGCVGGSYWGSSSAVGCCSWG